MLCNSLQGLRLWRESKQHEKPPSKRQGKKNLPDSRLWLNARDRGKELERERNRKLRKNLHGNNSDKLIYEDKRTQVEDLDENKMRQRLEQTMMVV